MKKTSIALIGCGAIANGRHIPAYLALPEVEVKYCVDIIEERALGAAAKFTGCKALTSHKDIVKAKDIDAAIICTPNGSHAEIAIDFLNAGKHVFCEKPLSVNYQSCQAVLDAAKRNGKICDVGVCNRYRKAVIKVKELIESGDMGEIYHVYCSFRQHRSIPGLGGDFTTKAKSGGGVLIDWGVHLFDLIFFCCGIEKLQTASANTYSVLARDIGSYEYINMWAGPPKLDGTNDVEEMVSGFLRTSGPSISFNGAWAQNIKEDNMFIEFLGTKGGIKVDYYGKYTVYSSHNGVFYTADADFNDNDMYYSEIKAFASSVQSGIKNNNHIENVMELQRTLDTIYRSAELKREVVL